MGTRIPNRRRIRARQQASLSRKNIFADKWQQNLQHTIQQQVEGQECESCPEAYEIEKVRAGVYTYAYLQELCIWLHETLELNCRGK